MSWTGAAITGAWLAGGVALVAGIGHWVASATVAFGERGGLDARFGMMLLIGLLPAGAGALMLYGAWKAGGDASAGLTVVAVAGAVFTASLIALFPKLSAPPNGSAWGTAVGLAGFAAESVLAWMAR